MSSIQMTYVERRQPGVVLNLLFIYCRIFVHFGDMFYLDNFTWKKMLTNKIDIILFSVVVIVKIWQM